MSDKINDVTVTFQVKGLEDTLHVMEFFGEERISSLFRLNLVLACKSSSLDFTKVVGKQGLLTLTNNNGDRYVHGIVCRFQQREQGRNFTVYQAVVVPQVWRLLHKHDIRIYQNQSIKKIITDILTKANVEHKFRTKGNKEPTKRVYCVQYRESYWNFISRLLEEEGFFYYFEHKKDKHVLHMGNDNTLMADIAKDDDGKQELDFHPPTGLTPGKEHITLLHYTEQIRSGKVTLNDFNFEKPSLSFRKDAKAELDTDLEVYDYPGLFDLPETGKGLADIRLEERQAGKAEGDGQSDCLRFSAGHCFMLKKHYRSALNDQKYVLQSVSHYGEKHQDLEAGAVSQRIRYHNTFGVMPRKTPFRPLRTMPKPVVHGLHTAIVVGPENEEIHTDKHGRVKVQFHWDRDGKSDDKSSCWIRVSQLWAGQGWGAMYIPRIGQEVIVDFLEGDPDRPIITGRVYHEQNPVPYTLPADKTKSTIKSRSTPKGTGFNEIRFEDKKGSEELFTHAEKDQVEVVKNNMSTSVGNNQTLTVTKDRTKTVNGKEESTIKKDRTAEVTEGNESLTVKAGTRAVTVKKDTSLTVQDGNYTLTTSKASMTVDSKQVLTIKAGKSASITSPEITVDGGKSCTIQSTKGKVVVSGKTTVDISAPDITISATKSLSLGVGTNSITIDTKGITTGGTEITTSAVGVHNLSGAVIKLN